MNPLGALKELQRDVTLLQASGMASPDLEFVQEVVLPLLGSAVGPEPEPLDPPVLTFDADTWTLVSGSYYTVDNRGRPAEAVGNELTGAVFTAPIVLPADSDWTISLRSTGEINEQYSAVIVEETGGGGAELETVRSLGLYAGQIRSGPVGAGNTMAWSPTATTYQIVHEAGVTSIYIYGALVASGAGLAASGSGEITLTIPPDVVVFGLWIYDYAVPV